MILLVLKYLWNYSCKVYLVTIAKLDSWAYYGWSWGGSCRFLGTRDVCLLQLRGVGQWAHSIGKFSSKPGSEAKDECYYGIPNGCLAHQKLLLYIHPSAPFNTLASYLANNISQLFWYHGWDLRSYRCTVCFVEVSWSLTSSVLFSFIIGGNSDSSTS